MPGDIGLALVGGPDPARAEIDAHFFQPQVFDDGRPAGGVQNAIGQATASRRHPRPRNWTRIALDPQHLRTERWNSMPFALQDLQQARGDFPVAAGGDLRQHLDRR